MREGEGEEENEDERECEKQEAEMKTDIVAYCSCFSVFIHGCVAAGREA
jgi:hypothetical protein